MAAADARQLVAEVIPGFYAEARGQVELLVSELVTNAVRHGGLADGATIEFSVELLDGCIRVEVRDTGRGLSIVAVRTARTNPPDPHAQSGWGLRIVDAIADRWGVDDDDGALVWFEMDLRRVTS